MDKTHRASPLQTSAEPSTLLALRKRRVLHARSLTGTARDGFYLVRRVSFSTTCHEAAHALAAKSAGTTPHLRADRYRSIDPAHPERTLGHGRDSHPLADH